MNVNFTAGHPIRSTGADLHHPVECDLCPSTMDLQVFEPSGQLLCVSCRRQCQEELESGAPPVKGAQQ